MPFARCFWTTNPSSWYLGTTSGVAHIYFIEKLIQTARARSGHVPDQSGLRPGHRHSAAASRRSTAGAVLRRSAGCAETSTASARRAVVTDVSGELL